MSFSILVQAALEFVRRQPVGFVRVVEQIGDFAVIGGIVRIAQLKGVGNEFGLLSFIQQREAVMKFIRSLAENPNTAGDFTEKDGAGRTVQVKVAGRYAVTFWADHAVSEIKVTTSNWPTLNRSPG